MQASEESKSLPVKPIQYPDVWIQESLPVIAWKKEQDGFLCAHKICLGKSVITAIHD